MENLIREIEELEKECIDFFIERNLKLSQYVIITKQPVMIKFNVVLDNKHRLPKEIYNKLNEIIMSYYGIKVESNKYQEISN